MNLKTLLKEIGELAYRQKLVNYSAAGTSLDEINGKEIKWYPLLFSSPTGTHVVKENTTQFELTLTYVDRLLSDMSNDVDVLSSAISNLENIVNGIKQIPGVVSVEDGYTIRNFANTEKMNDSLGGAYANIRITVINDDLCIDVI